MSHYFINKNFLLYFKCKDNPKRGIQNKQKQPPEGFFKIKDFLQNFEKFTEKHQSPFYNKIAGGLQPFLKNRL